MWNVREKESKQVFHLYAALSIFASIRKCVYSHRILKLLDIVIRITYIYTYVILITIKIPILIIRISHTSSDHSC